MTAEVTVAVPTAGTPPPAELTVVIPTIGRPTLRDLLVSLERACELARVVVPVVLADDRQDGSSPLAVPPAGWLDVTVVTTSGGAGPAAARNAGWRRATTQWIAFLDDDVVVGATWTRDLLADLARATSGPQGTRIGAVKGRVEVPAPTTRRPTDRERNVGGLASAPWITADMAVRRDALEAVGGFDERFPRAYREDSDLGIRVRGAGWSMVIGSRLVHHPVADAPWSASVRAQRGNADDALMRHVHGRRWRDLAGAPPSSLHRHLVTTAAAAVAIATARRAPRASAAAAGTWLAATAHFAWRRIQPGPRTPHEVATMIATSVLIPPAALWWRARGQLRVLVRCRPRTAVSGRVAAGR